MDQFADAWLPVVGYPLGDGPQRHSQLSVGAGGISRKAFTRTLRRMERMTLVRRRRYAEAPPRVESELTEAGHELLVPIYALGAWIEGRGPAMAAATQGESPN
ncbi:helix-turn-helix domain-containing protein [Nocardia sp. PE-7]|uniref:winged helix-turn-helix transcriptional regulator n=1 Tax=Nocardia sp. PE-7 TaxID=3058426 RepID=UPI00265A18D2|nr:helix-turn-helix domain-containing protein [Nocardia sp. PE-7]WKG09130.1 helix-turn-helix domain-containing protein [Nocardia sp. PE-7]